MPPSFLDRLTAHKHEVDLAEKFRADEAATAQQRAKEAKELADKVGQDYFTYCENLRRQTQFMEDLKIASAALDDIRAKYPHI